jgi:hypothetical protein
MEALYVSAYFPHLFSSFLCKPMRLTNTLIAKPMFSDVVADTRAMIQQSRELFVIPYVLYPICSVLTSFRNLEHGVLILRLDSSRMTLRTTIKANITCMSCPLIRRVNCASFGVNL